MRKSRIWLKKNQFKVQILNQGDTRLQLIEKGLGLSYKEYRYRNGAFNFKKLSKSYRNFVDDIKTNKGDENYKCNIFNGVYHQDRRIHF